MLSELKISNDSRTNTKEKRHVSREGLSCQACSGDSILWRCRCKEFNTTCSHICWVVNKEKENDSDFKWSASWLVWNSILRELDCVDNSSTSDHCPLSIYPSRMSTENREFAYFRRRHFFERVTRPFPLLLLLLRLLFLLSNQCSNLPKEIINDLVWTRPEISSSVISPNFIELLCRANSFSSRDNISQRGK